ncbi:hypothetical protein CNECB9_5340021 [Cupriavidus necator]|uniref:Uncharacterized protein n=1 Tax=Cupriavidus necator TaxID=106590 RepID=A0A1K0IPN9_CUPNE|nr:hypothetical protein CNECB9_5340021 [Cupriavidus necator]
MLLRHVCRSSFTRMVHSRDDSYSATAFRAFEIAKFKSPRCGLFFCALASPRQTRGLDGCPHKEFHRSRQQASAYG